MYFGILVFAVRTDKEEIKFNTLSEGWEGACNSTVLPGRVIIFPTQTAYCVHSSLAFQRQASTDVQFVIQWCSLFQVAALC